MVPDGMERLQRSGNVGPLTQGWPPGSSPPEASPGLRNATPAAYKIACNATSTALQTTSVMQHRWRYARVSGTASSSVGIPKPRNFKDQGQWRAAETGMPLPSLWLSAEHREALNHSISISLAQRDELAIQYQPTALRYSRHGCQKLSYCGAIKTKAPRNVARRAEDPTKG